MSTKLSFNAVSNIQRGWEIARLRAKSTDEMGISIFQILLARCVDKCKKPFRLSQVKQIDLDNEAVERALRERGSVVTELLNDLMSFTGPDDDMFHIFLDDVAKDRRSKGYTEGFFEHLGVAIRIFLQSLLGDDEYTKRMDEAWEAFFAMVCHEMKLRDTLRRAQRRIIKIQNRPLRRI